MTTQKIRLLGDSVLSSLSIKVTTFDKELRGLVKDLTETMVATDAAGLSAPQIGVSSRVFVYRIGDTIGHVVNPRLHLSQEIQDGPEGCMSLPDLQFDVKRSMLVIAQGFNEYGEPVEIIGTQRLSRIIQHETDHLDGILFIERLPPGERERALAEVFKSQWFNATLLNDGKPLVKISPH